MTNIDELVEIIKRNGGTASIEEIIKGYQKKHPMVILSEHKAILLKTLSSNSNLVFFNVSNNKWLLKYCKHENEIKKDYLTVEENLFFKTIAEAMLYIFDKRVPLSQGYFKVGLNERVWFPQPFNDNWENTMSTDGQFWYESPKKTWQITLQTRSKDMFLNIQSKAIDLPGFIYLRA